MMRNTGRDAASIPVRARLILVAVSGLLIGAQFPPMATKDGPPRAHDPVIAKEGQTYTVFFTGPGVFSIRSKDLTHWDAPTPVLRPAPDWTATTIPGNRGFFWAPDISFFDGRWHLYYSVSTFGRNRSAIGLATNSTLDPASKGYGWKDEGIVIESRPEDDFNAIDPNLVLDAKGTPWLTFGSFWTGIKMVELNRKTGKPSHPNTQPIALARRPKSDDPADAIEAPFVVRHGRFYYLFASYDYCCRGVNSTYNVRVGRSREVAGPYVDRDGKPMLEGGGTMVVSSAGRWKGPGHNAVFHDRRADWLVYHAYDAEDHGIAKLRIDKIDWTRDGWPIIRPAP